MYTPVSQQTYSCYCCSSVILDHTTMLCMTRPTLSLILLSNAHVQLSQNIEQRQNVCS